jgi:hypothetical protein
MALNCSDFSQAKMARSEKQVEGKGIGDVVMRKWISSGIYVTGLGFRFYKTLLVVTWII